MKEFHKIPVRDKWVLSDIQVVRLLNSKYPLLYSKRFIMRARHVIATFIYILVFFRVIYFYIRQFFVIKASEQNVSSLILSSGRGYDFNNINKLFEINEYININAFTITDYMEYSRVGLFTLIRQFFLSVYSFNSILNLDLPDKIMLLLLSRGLRNISVYTYLRSFFLTFKSKYSNITVYTDGAILASHAASTSNITTIRTCHGLIEKIHPNSYPEYETIYVYAQEEKDHIMDNMDKGVKSKVHIYPVEELNSIEKTVVFFMANSINSVNHKDFNELVEMFKSFNYEILMKVHPLSDAPKKLMKEYNFATHNWRDILDTSFVKEVDGLDGADVIKKYRPSFVVGWDSTALYEALSVGSIPINFIDPNSNHDGRGIYLVYEKSLKWPDDKRLIKDIIYGNYHHKDIISSLRETGRDTIINYQ